MNRFSKGVLWKGGLVLALLIGVLFVSTAHSQQPGNRILKYGFDATDIKTLDPHRATGSQDRILVEMVFNGLVRFNPGHLSPEAIEPDLAETWTVSADGREWVFHLKKGITWHPYEGTPGHELTSEDVVYSLKKAADPKRSAFSGSYIGVAFEAIDKYTVKISIERALSPILFLPRFANRGGGLVVCKGAFEDKGDEWCKTHPVGTGPFMFKSYTPQEKVELVANMNYFRGAPRLAGIEFFLMPEMISAELALQKGELDLMRGPRDQTWAEKMKMKPSIVVDAFPNPETIVAHFNMTVVPLNNIKVRQAIVHAMNLREYEAVYGPMVAKPIYSPVPAGLMVSGLTKKELSQKKVLYDFDIAKAKRLLTEAGYSKGFTIHSFTSKMLTIKKPYEVLQAQLRQIGIDLKLSVVDHSTYHANIRKNLNAITVYVCFRPNPDIILTQFFHSYSVVGTGKKPVTNFSHFGAVDADGDGVIDSIDNLIEAARIEVDPPKQIDYWKEAQIKILQYVVAIPLLNAGYLYARHPNVDYGYTQVAIADGFKPTENTKIAK